MACTAAGHGLMILIMNATPLAMSFCDLPLASGAEAGIFLERGDHLHGGDKLAAEDGSAACRCIRAGDRIQRQLKHIHEQLLPGLIHGTASRQTEGIHADTVSSKRVQSGTDRKSNTNEGGMHQVTWS